MALSHNRAGQKITRTKSYKRSGRNNNSTGNNGGQTYFGSQNRPRGGRDFQRGGKGRNPNRYSNSSQGNRNPHRGSGRFQGNRNSGRSQGKNRFKGAAIPRHLFENNLQEQVVVEQKEFKGKSYASFDFDYKLARNIAEKGYTTTTKIQDQAIPLILKGENVLGISATGSGKTGAFLIPMIQKMLTDKSQRLLIVAPTRELAMQIAKEAVSLIRGTDIYLSVLIGGESMGKQLAQLKRGSRIVVATPGRLNDHAERGSIRLAGCNNIVVDEVDRMMDMGFIKDVQKIFTMISPDRQALFFSATLNKVVEKTVAQLSPRFELIKLAENKPNNSVVQSIVDYKDKDHRFELLSSILKREDVKKAIVFVETKHFADKVEKKLGKDKIRAGAIHGNKRQNVRMRTIDAFKKSNINVLVATNVAARGIDIDDITHVINFDEPTSYDEYIHRIGRTGRNGKLGTAYTFVESKK